MSTKRSAFTLIELLVVIAIVAVLAVVVILALNPAELLKQARDSNRISDISTMRSALSLYSTDVTTQNLGPSTTTTYLSIVDPTATTTAGTICSSLDHCAASSTAKKVDSTGWLPVNLTSISSGAPFSALPIDPTNSTSSGLYYSYLTDGITWQVSALPESQKYQTALASNATTFTAGSKLTLIPTAPGLVGYWPMDEGSGSTANDASGNGNAGTWSGTQAGTSGYYSTGKVGSWAGYFNGSNDYVSMLNSSSGFQFGTGNFSVSAWAYVNIPANFSRIVGKKTISGNDAGFSVYYPNYGSSSTANLMYSVANGTTAYERYTANTLTVGWHHIVMVADSSDANKGYYYVDGIKWMLQSASGNVNVNNSSTLSIGGGDTGWYPFTGLIDDVRIYNRALSAGEIQTLYNATK